MLCNKMTESQELLVFKEVLDQFPSDYRNSMVSEGVLSFDQNRYSFGHEAFFDYCFARVLYGKTRIPDRVPQEIGTTLVSQSTGATSSHLSSRC